jgi:hypothetical protein
LRKELKNVTISELTTALKKRKSNPFQMQMPRSKSRKTPIILVSMLICSVIWATLAASNAQAPSLTQVQVSESHTLQSKLTAGAEKIAPSYEKSSTYISPVYKSENSFGLLSLTWEQDIPEETLASIEVRFRHAESEGWSGWNLFYANHDAASPHENHNDDSDHEAENSTAQSGFLVTDEATAFQYRATLSSENSKLTPQLSSLNFELVNGGKPSTLSTIRSKLAFDTSLNLISRDAWGANENYRLAENYLHLITDDVDEPKEEEEEENPLGPAPELVSTIDTYGGEDLWWSQGYTEDVEKIIIHHTATDISDGNYEQDVRDIYYYHAMSRAWGDIGYNYLIDPDGNIYEGRAGGEGVVAGHAYQFNRASVGIALLGNYQNEALPTPMLQSLMALVQDQAELFDIDVDSTSDYRGLNLNNLLGHSDVAATACPGEQTYDYLSEIRTFVGASLKKNKNTNSDWAYEEQSDRDLITLIPGDQKAVYLRLKNTGSKTWTSSTYLKVEAQNDADDLAKFNEVQDGKIALLMQDEVAPGETGTFLFTLEAQDNDEGGIGLFEVTPVFNAKTLSTQSLQVGVVLEALSFDFTLSEIDSPSSLKKDDTIEVTVKLQNTGSMQWNQDGDFEVQLRRLGNSDLTSESVLATLNESTVRSGGTGTFTFNITGEGQGTEALIYRLYAPDQFMFSAHSGSLYVKISDTTSSSSSTSNSTSSTNASGSTLNTELILDHADLSFESNESRRIWVQIENTTDENWNFNEDTNLVIQADQNITIGDVFSVPPIVIPGAKTKLYFDVTAPEELGLVTLDLRLQKDGQNLSTEAMQIQLQVGTAIVHTNEHYEMPIRVLLTPDQSLDTTVLSADESFSLYSDETLLKTFSANSRVSITEQLGSFKIASGIYTWNGDGPITLIPDEGGVVTVHTMTQLAYDGVTNDNQFLGSIELQHVPIYKYASGMPNWNGNLELALINELSLEDYMRGVAEESNSEPQEKIKAVLLAAQNYALFYMGEDAIDGASWPDNKKFPGMPYHLSDDPAVSQKYLGYSFQMRAPQVMQAYEQIKNLAITHDDEIVKTPYFSQSDGVATKSAQSVWGWTHTPYLVSVDDSICTDSDGTFKGHGVGMSGCGAHAMADEGATFEEILKNYYTGVDIVELKSI